MFFLIKSIASSLSDLCLALRGSKFWTTFGLNEVKSKYRRTVLGQWWIIITILIFLCLVGLIFKNNFYYNYDLYFIYLSTGYITWLFLHDCLNGACNIMLQSKQFLLQKKWPIFAFIFKLIYREIIILIHHCVLLVGIYIWFEHSPGIFNVLLSLLGLIFTIFTAVWVCLILSIACLRYNDLVSLIQSFLRIFFFATPIFWIDRQLGDYLELIILFNPFNYYLKIIRDPLLKYDFPYDAWIIAIVITIAISFLSIVVLSFTKKKLNYWL